MSTSEAASEQTIEETRLVEAITTLVASGRQPLSALGLEQELLAELGFDLEGTDVVVPALERLAATVIEAELSQNALRWLEQLDVFPVVGSTSSLLLDRSARGSVAGHLALAELQVGGRGRRGRRWQSPFGSNLAMSMGLRLPLPPARLGGFSLAVGLALLDALERFDVQGVELKWPNDVLLRGTKLAGILIDVVLDGDGVQLVVGVGVNVSLPPATLNRIDQPAVDLSSTGVTVSRNRLAAALASSILDFATAFAVSGFEPMRAMFDARHAYQGRLCRVLEGNSSTEGEVCGVNADGELLLETSQGLRAFAAGEVSLRVSS